MRYIEPTAVSTRTFRRKRKPLRRPNQGCCYPIWRVASDLTGEEREILQMTWESGKRPQGIAVSRSQPIPIVIARLASAKTKVTARLFVAVKCELHQSRSKKYGSTALRMKEKSREMSSYY